jgi:hypothetical protein
VTGLPFTTKPIRIIWAALVLSAVLLSACATQTIQIPTLPPSEEPLHDDPVRDAQSRLLTEAHRAFSQARYPTAILFFTRFIEASPDSPRLAEARWWLARTHEETGDLGAAMTQYRILAIGPPGQRADGYLYEEEALKRLDELRQRQVHRPGSLRHLALRVTEGQLPPVPDRMAWLQQQLTAGVTALILEPDSAGRSDADSADRMKGLVAEAHRAGLAVWVSLDVHRPQGWTFRPEWLAQTVSRRNSDEGLLDRPDLAHPGYQTALEERARTLALSGCDGLFLPARAAPGLSTEFSAESFAAFAASFGISVSPQQVLGDSSGHAPAQDNAHYWRWVGWKGASYAKLLARIRTALRERNPAASLLIEVHQTTLTAPVQGLEQYGEDITDLAQRTGGSMVLRPDGSAGDALMDKLAQQLGTTDRVWVEIPSVTAYRLMSTADHQASAAGIPQVRQWSTIIMGQ